MNTPADSVQLDVSEAIWERFFTVAPLVLIGTRDPSGAPDLAPKHMITPLGWENYFGFVCTPRHQTWRNISATDRFTVSYPRPDQLLLASLAATPRCDDDSKPVVGALDTFDAPDSGLPMLRNAYLWFDCRLERIVDGFGANGLIAGRIEHACAANDLLLHSDMEADAQIGAAPLLAYVHPGRFARVATTYAFPFPAGMKK